MIQRDGGRLVNFPGKNLDSLLAWVCERGWLRSGVACVCVGPDPAPSSALELGLLSAFSGLQQHLVPAAPGEGISC